MKKTIILIIVAVLVIAAIVAACLLMPKNNNNNDNPTETTIPQETITTMPEDFQQSEFPLPTIPGPENPEQYLHECFDLAKEALGDEYYPNVTVEPEKIPEMFGVNPDDYNLAFAQVCDDKTKVDMVVAIQGKDAAAMARILEDLNEYAQKIGADESYSKQVRTAMNVYITSTDIWNYVFLVTTFGDIDSIADKTEQEIMDYAEKNALKAITAMKIRNEEAAPDPNKP